MLVEFCVGNYRSFLDRVTLSMIAASIRSQDKELDKNNVFEVSPKLRLLTSAAIYGANASGKSNLVRAIKVMRDLVLRSTEGTDPIGGIPVDRFRLNTETSGKPSFFQAVFFLDGVRYRYGFEATTERIETEWLYYVPKTVEARLFEREGDDFTFGTGFREGKDFVERVRPNALMLSTAAQWNNPVARGVVGWYRSKLKVASGLEDTGMRIATINALKMAERRNEIVELVRRFDVGVEDLLVETTPFAEADLATALAKAPPALQRLVDVLVTVSAKSGEERELVSVKTRHRVFDADGNTVDSEEFDLQAQESDGTQKLFALSGPLLDVLKAGRILVIDEFDARLHPLITNAIIALFNSPYANPHHAQLVFATHDTNLLDRRYFRRDQIWFTEKDRASATQLYSLVEFKVRNDASYGRDYIRGKYGAVPYLGNLERLASEGSLGELDE